MAIEMPSLWCGLSPKANELRLTPTSGWRMLLHKEKVKSRIPGKDNCVHTFQ
jgi:hypothetical protein